MVTTKVVKNSDGSKYVAVFVDGKEVKNTSDTVAVKGDEIGF